MRIPSMPLLIALLAMLHAAQSLRIVHLPAPGSCAHLLVHHRIARRLALQGHEIRVSERTLHLQHVRCSIGSSTLLPAVGHV